MNETTNKKRFFSIISTLLLSLSLIGCSKSQTEKSIWAITPFTKVDSVNPVLQVNQVCFIEGMVPFKNNWFLYYGTADSKIVVATSPLPK